jgi:hypothetical protein
MKANRELDSCCFFTGLPYTTTRFPVASLHVGGKALLASDLVVTAAQQAFSARIKGSSDISENTKNAQLIAKTWRGIVYKINPDRFQIEALVCPYLDQKIDIVDSEAGCAYEFKVSGKNAWAEFYKDIVKVIIWNQKHDKKLSKLIFITEENHGRQFLNAPMPKEYISYLAQTGLTVQVEYAGLSL